jgi:two-component SAPR family response regulator
VDALFLLKHAARLDSQWRLSAAPEMTREAQRLLDLYQGPFVDDGMTEAWAEAFQARLRRSCLGLFEHLGRYRQEREEWQAAAAAYESAIDIDPLAEAFYLALMDCYERLGRSGEVFRIYQQCRRSLEQVLGTQPSSLLHEKLRAVLSQ